MHKCKYQWLGGGYIKRALNLHEYGMLAVNALTETETNCQKRNRSIYRQIWRQHII